MYTVGTAGHIDHGKTTLCKLLTGVDTDRLEEEKKRGISIDLGFAHLKTPSGKQVGIVDVPGHERFIRNMVAGVSGIEAVLFTIAADEGIMPQTREHFDILGLLGVSRGILVLTKCDLVERDWLQMVRDEVAKYLAATPFAGMPIVEVSREDPTSIGRLIAGIDRMLDFDRIVDRGSLFRLPIDRSFSLKGHGTVVTGTVTSGRVAVGEQVEILPAGLRSRVRSIQSFFSGEQEAVAGQRAALNLPDLEAVAVERGDTAAIPGGFTPSSMLDVRVTLLKEMPPGFPTLKNASRVRFHVGTTEVIGRVHLLETKEMERGTEQHVQLRLERPVVASRQDRFLLRTFSPLFTIGGGFVIEPHPTKHRHDPDVIAKLTKLSDSDPAALVRDQLARTEAALVTAQELAGPLSWRVEVVEEALGRLGTLVAWTERRKRRYHYSIERVEREGVRIRELVLGFHKENPLVIGIERAALAALFNPRIEPESFSDLLFLVARDRGLVVDGSLVRDLEFTPVLDSQTEIQLTNIERHLTADGFVTPSELFGSTGLKKAAFDKLIGLLVAQGVIAKLPGGLLSHRRTIAEYERRIVELLTRQEKASVGEIKEALVLTRKSLIPLLEFFDEKGVTFRAGNDRRLRHRVGS